MKIDVMTSFNKHYYEHVGKYSVISFLEHWPEDINLLCYVEGCRLDPHPRIKQIPLESLDQEFHDFMNSDKYKHRTKTFAKKGYSWVDAVMTSDADYLIWLDADVMTKQVFPKSVIESYCSKDLLATFMGVWYEDKKGPDNTFIKLPKPLFGSETCVYFFNLRHPEAKKFAARYKEYYSKGLTENLRRFIDTDVWGACVEEWRTQANFNDLNPGNYRSPLPRTALHPYLEHLKAGLKDMDDLDRFLKGLIGPLFDKPKLQIYESQ